jgi:PAS domain S-box-containing protein
MSDDDRVPAPGSDEHRYRSTLDSLLEGFQIIGHDWAYLYVNPAAARHGRQSPQELQGRKIWEAYPGIEETPLFAVLKRCMTDRRAASLENFFTFPDKTSRWFEIRVEPVPEGLCVHSIDIQHRKSAETALRQLNKELEQRVAARTRELQEVNEELEAFGYSVSHDLQAPLRHIGGFAGLLSERAQSGLDEQSQHYLKRIIEASRRMGSLIDDLLTFSRIGRAPIQKRPISLTDVVHEAQAQVAQDRAGTDIVWTVGQLPTVPADSGLMHVVFVNLLSNAVKFSRSRTPPRIEVSASRDETKGEIVIAVRDNGVGFEMRYADKLFGVFQRLHTEAEFEGNGIGLATVRRIIARHGGRVWAEGVVDQGATVYLALPLQGAGSG